ncbi:DUF3492 domain-containing protein [Streptomyces sp. NPDC003077]|uniref:DUF3492 domain-containing protein n=1 Tax=Streptomyces sp. NPDC003077 TaxID=3154443 RepID=UPI00339EA901
MRIGLLTDGAHAYASGEVRAWCDRLVRGLTSHEFDIYAVGRDACDAWPERAERRGEQGTRGGNGLPERVRPARTAVRGEPPGSARACSARRRPHGVGRRQRRRFLEHFGDLVAAFSTAPDATAHGAAGPAPDPFENGSGRTPARAKADRFAAGLYGLAELARDGGGLPSLLRSEQAVRTLDAACRASGALRTAHGARVADLLAVADRLERELRPLSLDWYGDPPTSRDRHGGDGLAGVDLCHATSSGTAALPGLLAKRFFGTPLLVTEHGTRLREQHLARAASPMSPPARALTAAFQSALTAETYARAVLVTPDTAHTRRWQERCGADRDRLRTVYPGVEAGRFTAVPDAAADRSAALVWVGGAEPARELVCLLHAFAQVRRAEPTATLRIVRTTAPHDAHRTTGPDHLAHCRALADRLCPPAPRGGAPVAFDTVGGPGAPGPEHAYAAGTVIVLSGVAEGFPRSLVEAMLCGRATVSTDVGAACEVIGGTGLVVPPGDPHALADACLALLRDPARRARLGAAARARALELFTAERCVAAFRGIYLELISHAPARPDVPARRAAPQLFARPAEASVPGRWTAARGGTGRPAAPGGRVPHWAGPGPHAGEGTASPVGATGSVDPPPGAAGESAPMFPAGAVTRFHRAGCEGSADEQV